MYDSTEFIKQSVAELNADSESSAKQKIKDIVRGIVQQQSVIATANAKIAELQKSLKEIKVETVDINSLGI